VVGTAAAVALAASVDVVLVTPAVLATAEPTLAEARRRGAVVVLLTEPGQDVAAPSWCSQVRLPGSCIDAASWRAAVLPLAVRWGRTTGWPWREHA
jgi:hypothetical protein